MTTCAGRSTTCTSISATRLAGTDPSAALAFGLGRMLADTTLLPHSAEPQVLAAPVRALPDRERPRLAGRSGREAARPLGLGRPRLAAALARARVAGRSDPVRCRYRLSSVPCASRGACRRRLLSRSAGGRSAPRRARLRRSRGQPARQRPPPGLSLRLEVVLGDPEPPRPPVGAHRLDGARPMRPSGNRPGSSPCWCPPRASRACPGPGVRGHAGAGGAAGRARHVGRRSGRGHREGGHHRP